MPHPMFTFKVGGTPFKMCSDPRPYTTDVLRMHSVKPFFGAISGLAFLQAQHGFPTGRKIDFVGFQIPVPQPVVDAAGNKRIPFLALAKRFFRALARFAKGFFFQGASHCNRQTDQLVFENVIRYPFLDPLHSGFFS